MVIPNVSLVKMSKTNDELKSSSGKSFTSELTPFPQCKAVTKYSENISKKKRKPSSA